MSDSPMYDPFEPEIDKPRIVKATGTPKKKDNDETLTRRDVLAFEKVASFLAGLGVKSYHLVEEFAKAKVNQETNAAKKLAEEAGESAARREETEAKAGKIKQETFGSFIENLQQLEQLSPVAQKLAFAKMLADSPEILDQMELIESMIDKLKLVDGASICPIQPTVIEESKEP